MRFDRLQRRLLKQDEKMRAGSWKTGGIELKEVTWRPCLPSVERDCEINTVFRMKGEKHGTQRDV